MIYLMVNIYDNANQLAKDLQETPEFKELQTAVKAVMDNAESADLFKQMDAIQTKIINAQQTGAPLSEDDQKAYQDLNKKVQDDKNIVKLLQSEQGVYKLLDDVQKTFTNPINDLYADLRK